MPVVATVLAAGPVLYAIVIEPLWGRRVVARLRRRATTDPDARVAFYRLTLASEWTWTLIALAAFALSGLPGSAVFLAWPRLEGDVVFLGQLAIIGGLLTGLFVGGVAAGVASRRAQGPLVAGDVDALLPRNTRERRWYTAVAVTAGICEEVLYRGVVLVVAMLLLPTAPLWVLALGVAAVFGAAHIYQGLAGVAAAAALGVVLGLIVVATGSLLPAMALHALIDLRVLLLRPPAR